MSHKSKRKLNARSKSLQPTLITNTRTCKFKHASKRIDLSAAKSITCTDCKSKINKDGTVYGCSRCKFYLCSACFRKPSCSNGHLLKAAQVQKNSTCSVCQYKSKKQRLIMYSCRVCKFNMCLGTVIYF